MTWSRALVALQLACVATGAHGYLNAFCTAVNGTVCGAHDVDVTFFFGTYLSGDFADTSNTKFPETITGGGLFLNTPDSSLTMPFSNQGYNGVTTQDNVASCATAQSSWSKPLSSLDAAKASLMAAFGPAGTCASKTFTSASGTQLPRIDSTYKVICYNSDGSAAKTANPIVQASANPMCSGAAETAPVKTWFAMSTKLDVRTAGSYTLSSGGTARWFKAGANQPCSLQAGAVDFSRALTAMRSELGVAPPTACAPGQGKKTASCDGKTWTTTCETCPAGKYSSVSSVEQPCQTCSGTVVGGKTCQVNAGACTGKMVDDDQNPYTPCTLCPAGSEVVGGVCKKCTAGNYDHDQDSSTGCNQCYDNVNGNNAAGGAISCAYCGKGTYDHDNNAKTACTACPVGSDGATGIKGGTCTTCAVGKYDHDADSSTACQACSSGVAPGGTYGSAGCAPCVAGTYDHDGTSTTACKACPAGKYGKGGAEMCSNCTAGSYDHDMNPATPCQAFCSADNSMYDQEVPYLKQIVEAQYNKSQALYDAIHSMLVSKQAAQGRRRLLKLVLGGDAHNLMGGQRSEWQDDHLDATEMAGDEDAQTLLDHALDSSGGAVDRDALSLTRTWNLDGSVEISVVH